MDRAAGVAKLDGARHLGGRDEVAQGLVAPRGPVAGLGQGRLEGGLRGGVPGDVGAGLGDLGVGVERARGLERKLRRADLGREHHAVRELRLNRAVGEPRVARGERGERDQEGERGGQQAGEGGAHRRECCDIACLRQTFAAGSVVAWVS